MESFSKAGKDRYYFACSIMCASSACEAILGIGLLVSAVVEVFEAVSDLIRGFEVVSDLIHQENINAP